MSTETKPINDGGPAFPVMNEHYPNGEIQYGCNGMTLRDYFAAKAMASIIVGPNAKIVEAMEKNADFQAAPLAAKMAYEMADAMLKARES